MLSSAQILERLYGARVHADGEEESGELAAAPRTPSDGDADAPPSFPAAVMSSKTVWLASFLALGTADFASVARLSPASLGALSALGIAGGAGLAATSADALRRNRSTEERLDAANNIAWGGQGLMVLIPSSLGATVVGLGLGLVGSTLQTAVGLMRVRNGLRTSDAATVKLGLLDVGGGLLWLAWDVMGARQPLFIATYMVAKAGREAYANREALRRVGAMLARRALDACRRAAGATSTLNPALEPG